MIEIKNLSCFFGSKKVLDNININIEKGSFTAVVGRNGSGKSTLARHLNALRIPQDGDVFVDGMNTRNEKTVFDIREKVGMVFQNPESQAVASIVEDDTAFAPENLGLDEDEINGRVDRALRDAGIEHLRYKSISTLSGGQKQLTAIAGILAMNPEYMIFDEGTSMLDPVARHDLMEKIVNLKELYGITVIWITHYMEEAARADRIIVMDNGKIKADRTPKEIFTDIDLIKNSGLELPQSAQIAIKMRDIGIDVPYIPMTPSECADMVREMAHAET